jgi:hypothetical protein
MEHLVAKYRIELEHPIYVRRSETDELKYGLNINDAYIEVLLIPSKGSKEKHKNERLGAFAVDYVELSISLPENEKPPPADITPKDGHGSYYEIEQYFDKRIKKYTDIAKIVYQRLLKYFKYRKGTPYLFDIDKLSHFPLPIWFDENGEEIWKTRNRAVYVRWTPGWSKVEFGIEEFRKSDDKSLISAIKNDVDLTLYQEIMSDAQAAILQNNYRRGILEIAIACEIAVKQAFFAESTVSGVAYEYLENQGRVNVRTIDLISNVAEYVFGENFRLVNETAYRNIDYLFRCRNKIAHRGQVTYRDDNGVWHQPDRDTLRNWWASLEELLSWLNAKKRNVK